MFEKYDAYKDSGIHWIGQIPEHWEIEKAKWIFLKSDRPIRPNDGIVTCFRDGEVTLRSNRRINGFTNAIKEHGYQGIRKGDLVIHAMDAFAGAIGVSDSDGKSTPVYSACIPRIKKRINVYYYAYYLRNLALAGFIESLAKGIRERSTDFRFADFAELLLPFPKLEDQERIVAFLNQKTAEIDQAIAIKEQQIALLNERKQIVIQKAVTQGLDPNVPMKDSGVEWIGQIPEHWEILPLTKYSTRVDYRGKTPEKVEEGRLLVTTRNIKNGILDYEISKEYIKESQYKEVMSRGIPKKGDILFTMEAPLGHSAVVDREDIAIAQRIIKFRLDSERLNSYFINYYFQTDIFQNYLYGLGTGSTALGIKASKLGLLKLIAPNLYEQEKIVEFLITEEDKFNSAFELLNQEISKLKEYKTTLINDAVTGKIKVA